MHCNIVTNIWFGFNFHISPEMWTIKPMNVKFCKCDLHQKEEVRCWNDTNPSWNCQGEQHMLRGFQAFSVAFVNRLLAVRRHRCSCGNLVCAYSRIHHNWEWCLHKTDSMHRNLFHNHQWVSTFTVNTKSLSIIINSYLGYLLMNFYEILCLQANPMSSNQVRHHNGDGQEYKILGYLMSDHHGDFLIMTQVEHWNRKILCGW